MTEQQIESAEVSIPLDESGYGSGQHAIVLLTGPTKTALRKFIAERHYNRLHNGDRPGQAYATGLQCLRYSKGDCKRWQAVCVSSTYYDV